MKNKKASYFKTAALLFMLSFSFQPVFAQDEFDDNVDDETPAAFIDGFIVVGIAAGAMYGMKKLRKEQ